MDKLLADALKKLDHYDIPITIADARESDVPLTHVNKAFCDLTGYRCDEVIGRNFRFLLGELTDPASVEQLRTAIEKRRHISMIITNYRKNGDVFHNFLVMGPLDNKSHRDIIVGCQYRMASKATHSSVIDQIDTDGHTVDRLATTARASWTSYVDNLKMRSDVVNYMIRAHITHARLEARRC